MGIWTVWSDSPNPIAEGLSEEEARKLADELVLSDPNVYAEDEDGETYEPE